MPAIWISRCCHLLVRKQEKRKSSTKGNRRDQQKHQELYPRCSKLRAGAAWYCRVAVFPQNRLHFGGILDTCYSILVSMDHTVCDLCVFFVVVFRFVLGRLCPLFVLGSLLGPSWRLKIGFMCILIPKINWQKLSKKGFQNGVTCKDI